MNIEKNATNAVESAILVSDYLVPNIKSGDRDLSWDGDVEVYEKPGDDHAKSDLYLKVPVQVKGVKSGNLKKNEITYPVEISDMRNFLQVGGTIYFVVCIDPEGEKRIYFVRLLPYELRQLLERFGKQKSRRIKLRPFPLGKDEITDIFLSFARDMKKQKAAISTPPVSLEELAKAGQIREITFGYKGLSRKGKLPFDFMFDNGAYLYAKLDFGIELPVKRIEQLEAAKTTVDEAVTVNGRTFYQNYSVTYTKDTIEIGIGKSLRHTISRSDENQQTFQFALSGTLTERITDEEFMIEVIKAGQFKLGDTSCSTEALTGEELASFNMPRRQEHLTWMREVKQALDLLRVKEDLDCTNLSDVDERNLSLLKAAAVDKKVVPLKNGGTPFGLFKVGNLKLILFTKKSKEDSDLFELCSYNDAQLDVRLPLGDGQEVPASFHVLLRKSVMLECCNIDYGMVVEDMKCVPFSDKFSEQAVMLLLELLGAYDLSEPKREEFLSAATELAAYLRANDPYTPKSILDLNYFQTIKRKRSLTTEERGELLTLVEIPTEHEDTYVGAYLLLEDQEAAQMHFNKLDKDVQAMMREYPIWHFWQGKDK